MAVEQLLAIRHSSALRTVSTEEVFRSLRADGRDGMVIDVAVDTAAFGDDIEGGYWDESAGYVRRVAEEIRRRADELGSVELHYFGIAEVPHIIALGAYVGDERLVHVHDYDRDRDTWTWAEQKQTVTFSEIDLPSDPVPLPGSVVIRVEVSDSISDSEVDAVIARSEKLADVKIRPHGRPPMRGIIRSAEDVAAVKAVFREVLAQVTRVREVETVHLFIAAPVSVCFAIGQELHLRSGSAVQTYRHRTVEGSSSYREAIRLTEAELAASARPLTEEEKELARTIRCDIFVSELRRLLTYAVTKRDDATDRTKPWYAYLQPREALLAAAPFPTLPPIWTVIDDRDEVDADPYHDPLSYGRDKDRHRWRLGDRLLLALHRAVEGNETELRRLIRLFLFHEYLHDYQVLTKYTAEDVGSFANCLERIDYLADLYAVLHQLDYTLRQERDSVAGETAQREFIADQIDLAIRSFWAFESSVPNLRWQERRLRRYMNWFWRRVQVHRAPSLQVALAVLSRQPTIEIAGLTHVVGRGRVFVLLNRPRVGEDLEIGLVLENDRFQRYGTAGNLSIERMLEAFANAEHEQIQMFFNSLYETVNATGGAFPPEVR